MNNKKTTIMILTSILVMMFATLVQGNDGFNVPFGADTADIIRTETSNASLYTPTPVEAIAGNLTELNITGLSQTRTWQGFFGNVSGTIILEDSTGSRFYDWSAAEPQGQVYASVNDTITWTGIDCAPIENSTFRTSWYTFYGMEENDYDNLNMTYNATNHPAFSVGFENPTNCRTTHTFVNSARQFDDFPAVLLSDVNDALVFTAIIEDRAINTRAGKTGYDGGDYDFQLLVAENGRNGNTDTTTYYFWVEIY